MRVLQQTCIGAVIDRPELVDMFLERLPIHQFDGNLHRVAKAIGDLATDGEALTPASVVERLRVNGDLSISGGAPAVFDCWALGGASTDPRQEITTLSRLFALRDAWDVGNLLRESVGHMDLSQWIDLARNHIDRIAKVDEGSAPPVMTYLRDVLTGEDVQVEWCIPGLLPKGTATMLTAEEGIGKSTVLRQFGVAAMAGLQPFEMHREKYEPQRVLLVDCENPRNSVVRGLRAQWTYARTFNPIADTTNMAVESHQGGLDLSSAHDQGWLHRMVREHKANLIVIGPVYRFASGDLNTEEGVRSLVTEHHAPNAPAGTQRALRPIGSSAMRRWFGQGLSLRGKPCTPHEDSFCKQCQRKAQIESWRGGREEEARWPRYLMGEPGHPWWSRDEYAETMAG
jgi:hypothetical protein